MFLMLSGDTNIASMAQKAHGGVHEAGAGM